MASIAECPATIIKHYAMQLNSPLKLGIRTVRFHSGMRETITVTLTNGCKERWEYIQDLGWRRG